MTVLGRSLQELEKHHSVRKGVEVTDLLLANDMMLGESMFLCVSLFFGQRDIIPHRDVVRIKMVIYESIYKMQALGMLASLVSSVCGIIYLIIFYP